MNATYDIDVDYAGNALRVTMGGFFTLCDVEAFLQDVNWKLDQLCAAPNDHLMLCDVRQMKIQPQEVVQAFAQIVGSPRVRSKRLAFVTATSLSRLQARRLTDRDGVSFFGSMEAAEAWLFGVPDHAAIAVNDPFVEPRQQSFG